MFKQMELSLKFMKHTYQYSCKRALYEGGFDTRDEAQFTLHTVPLMYSIN